MSGIEVFQDLYLIGPADMSEELRRALIAKEVMHWRFDAEASRETSEHANDEVMVFACEGDDGLPAANLVLWPNDAGFYVPNVVPAKIGQLTIAQYNAVLNDFAEKVARPVAVRFGFEAELTGRLQMLEDWFGAEAAKALQEFSRAANKSSGASHPADQRRWFDFILAAYRNRRDTNADRLARWLHEVEKWDDESAHELAGQYETAIALLQRKDETE